MPQIWPHLGELYRAFLECRIRQPSGFGIDRITDQSMLAWFENNSIDADEREEFMIVIMALDDTFLAFHKSKPKPN